MTTKEMITYDQIIELNIATAEEINLVRCCISGTWTDVFNAIIYARTGYRSIEQYLDSEDGEE